MPLPQKSSKILYLNSSEYPTWDSAAWSVAGWAFPSTTVANDNLLWTVEDLHKKALTKHMRKQGSVLSFVWLGIWAKVIHITGKDNSARAHTSFSVSRSFNNCKKLSMQRGRLCRKGWERNPSQNSMERC